jgi:hypothetical protein
MDSAIATTPSAEQTMKKSVPNHQRPLALESLETRAMMAGNIDVSVVNGSLVIQGDELSNAVTIQQQAPGTFRIVTFQLDGAPTLINGSSDNDQTFSGVTADVNITMAGGNDSIRLNGATSPALIPRNLNVNGGAGSDHLTASVRVGQTQGGYVIVRNTGLTLNDSSVPKNLVTSGDSISLGNVVVGGDVSVTGRPIDDSVVMAGLQARNVSVETGGGRDTVRLVERCQIAGDVRILTGDGEDHVRIGSLTAANLTINLGPFAPTTPSAGIGHVSIFGQTNIQHVVRITGSEGPDNMTIAGLHAGDAIFAWLGAGNDRLTISNSSSPSATLRGGAGFDKLFLGEGNAIDEIDQTGFE